MDDKLNIKVIMKVIIFLIIGFVILHILTKILMPKWISVEDNRMTYIIKGFYKEPKNSLDIVFMGNSDVYRGISPIVMWDEYGIASYNFVSSGQRMWTAYYMLEECLKYQKPKLIVLNMDSAFNESQSSESNYRKAFDNMKFGINKLKAVNDPVFKNSKNETASYIFPIVRYHSRWSELTDEDFSKAFENNRFSYKGMDIITDIKPNNEGYSYMNKVVGDDIGEKSSKYLKKIIKLCKENDIQLLFMELPSADSWSREYSEKTAKFAKDNDVDFLDLNLIADKFKFDWKNDTCDGGDHLNVYGAEKVSKYLGKVLQEKYYIPNHKNDDEYKSWYDDSKKYHEDIKKLEQNIK